MADSDRWNDRRYRETERERSQRLQGPADYGQGDFSRSYGEDERGGYRADYSRAHRHEVDRDDRRFAPFGASGPVEGRDGAYDDHGDRYGGYRRSDHGRRAGGYGNDLGRYGPSPDYDAPYGRRYDDRRPDLEDRARRAGQEARSWWDRTTDKVGALLAGELRPGEPGYAAADQRGRGPKGYKRSDERIREDVSDRLTDDPYLDASDIEVQVADGEVTLSGTVRRRQDRRSAEDLAESVAGVGHVQNNLRADSATGELGVAGYPPVVGGPHGLG